MSSTFIRTNDSPCRMLDTSPKNVTMDSLIEQAPPAVLRPLGFLVSWQGVLALAYTGWPPSLVNLKQKLNSSFSSMPRESPGSLWPKTSLGALVDGVRLLPSQLELLTAICKKASCTFCVRGPGDGETASDVVLVDCLSLVTFECRCLERQLSSKLIRLSECMPDVSEPSDTETARVQTILKEPEDPGYWFHASKDGGRESHYRGNALGVTLVHSLCFSQPTAATHSGQSTSSTDHIHVIAAAIAALKSSIEAEPELRGLYTWFEPASLHVTLRGIMG